MMNGLGPVAPRPRPRRTKAERGLEEHWYEYLLFPLRVAWVWPVLVLFTAGLSIILAEFLPRQLAEGTIPPEALVFSCVCGLFLAGLPCAFLDCLFCSAAAGRWAPADGNLLLQSLRSAARWLLCFLAGPVLFAVTGYFYWLNCGETLLDNLILAELGVAGFAYWLFALLAVTESGRFRDLNPVAVVDTAHRLRWRGLAVVLAALLFVAHGWVLLSAALTLQGNSPKGWALVIGAWAGGVFWGMFFSRLLGIWCYRSRRALATSMGGRS